ncbi:hypothetical protein CABS01_10982 [Colletotrichum abscissum]|uniref:uncharacterized protein n=1 Tax=Colletotrichum abscissum TaxID=1671311 RepID=UPI0027D71F9B|nr:uncharacterized protein CABS01_10982 [Colletotrichum abscissum]KAK1496833.1 hypothetical protein CABS01_10982 [Colletotrichum abscissum]
MVESIASLVSRAEAQFSHLLNIDLSPGAGLLVFKFPKAKPTLADEQAILKVWAKIHEIHNTNSLSLECRLRNDSKLRDHVRQLLKSLLDILERIRKAFKDLRSAPVHLDSIVDDDPDISADIKVFVEQVPDIVDCLMRLNDTIKDPCQWDRYLSYHTDTSAFEALATQHVVTKFEGIQAYLAQRLGTAISRRRQHIEYRKAHQERLLHCVDGQMGHNMMEVPQDPAASLIPDHLNQVSQTNIYQDSSSEDAIGSVTFQNSTSAGAQRSSSILDMPKEARGGPFVCQLCYTLVDIRDDITWRQHVYEDLQPYNCLEEDCEAADRNLATSDEWMKHMRKHHFILFYCIFRCGCTFSSASECSTHLKTQHSDDLSYFPNGYTDSMIRSFPMDDEMELSCPFCFDNMPLMDYENHVGKHQQELALFAIPDTDDWTKDKVKLSWWSRLWTEDNLSWYKDHASIAITSLGL